MIFNKYHMVFSDCPIISSCWGPSPWIAIPASFPLWKSVSSQSKCPRCQLLSTPLLSLAVIHGVTKFMSNRTTVPLFLKCTEGNLHILRIPMWKHIVRKQLKQISSFRRWLYRVRIQAATTCIHGQ